MPPRASLVEDAGSSASSPGEFFRSPEFLEAEGVTHSLVIEGDGRRQSLPVLVREIPGSELLDAISPYGYPGAADPIEPPSPPGEVDWSGAGLVSVFVRDRIGGPACFAAGTERARVHIADPGRESGVRKRLREQIRRNERRGWSVARVPGPAASEADRAAFEAAYSETMARAGAAERYLYGADYFRRVLSADGTWLLLAGREGEAPSAGAIAAASDGHLHYYLGGTADESLADSPMKNLFAAMIELAAERELPLHLGAGVAAGDSLDEFKRGFANAEAAFITHELICDPDAYAVLSDGAEPSPGGFFPAYRAG